MVLRVGCAVGCLVMPLRRLTERNSQFVFWLNAKTRATYTRYLWQYEVLYCEYLQAPTKKKSEQSEPVASPQSSAIAR